MTPDGLAVGLWARGADADGNASNEDLHPSAQAGHSADTDVWPPGEEWPDGRVRQWLGTSPASAWAGVIASSEVRYDAASAGCQELR